MTITPRADIRKIIEGYTNRRLLKDFRLLRNLLQDIKTHQANGWKTYQGDPIIQRLNEATRWYEAVEKELTARQYDIKKIK